MSSLHLASVTGIAAVSPYVCNCMYTRRRINMCMWHWHAYEYNRHAHITWAHLAGVSSRALRRRQRASLQDHFTYSARGAARQHWLQRRVARGHYHWCTPSPKWQDDRYIFPSSLPPPFPLPFLSTWNTRKKIKERALKAKSRTHTRIEPKNTRLFFFCTRARDYSYSRSFLDTGVVLFRPHDTRVTEASTGQQVKELFSTYLPMFMPFVDEDGYAAFAAKREQRLPAFQYCGALQLLPICCSMLQYVVVCCTVLHGVARCCTVLLENTYTRAHTHTHTHAYIHTYWHIHTYTHIKTGPVVHRRHNTVLLGDAIHTVKPFFGFGKIKVKHTSCGMSVTHSYVWHDSWFTEMPFTP